jgi:hypothetical protein
VTPSPSAEAAQERSAGAVVGDLVEVDGARFFRVSNYDHMPPFFMTMVSDSDHWLFMSTTGGLTAGRGTPDSALFPYYTDDRIHDAGETTGSETLLRVRRGSETHLWEPFSSRSEGLYRTVRNLDKSVYGNAIRFEEVNQDLGLTFRYTWMTSERYGFVRSAEVENTGSTAAAVEVLDGIHNVLPSGVGQRFQMEFSTLVDGYKRTERVQGAPLALFRLSSIPSDRPMPSESLRVNLAWSTGLEGADILLSDAQLDRFRHGARLEPETDIRGQRGAFLVHANVDLEAGARRNWLIVAELDQDVVRVRSLMRELASAGPAGDGVPGGVPASEVLADRVIADRVLADVARGTRHLVHVVGSVDGLQGTSDERAVWRHFSNALFNAMRGGLPDDGYRISTDDLRSFLGASNVAVAGRQGAFLDALPETLLRSELLDRVADLGDLDMERLCSEYLPFTFSRRHGDPSRPWNRFSIRIKDDHGNKILNYEGNWRDIFQNWEALLLSYPGFAEGMIAKFLSSSTADGHNPYRVLREGFEWEIADSDEPWSTIGYWGDHQVIYLLRLLESAQRHRPGSLGHLLTRPVFTYADVPYRIRPYASLLDNPRETIDFDDEANAAALDRAARQGSDGLALLGADGAIVRANGTEKLLVVALAKLANFIPEAGIWLNTQRPEWNDGNNALVGNGVSVVTLCYLRRYLAFAKDLFATVGSGGAKVAGAEVADEVVRFLTEVASALEAHAGSLGAAVSDRDRGALMEALGEAGSRYRQGIYAASFSGRRTTITAEALTGFCDLALRHVDHSIRVNRRADGLYHSYNLMRVVGDGVELRHLQEMLEGQVAVLSSGVLSTDEAIALLDALRASDLYRADQASYILYPDRDLPHFLDKNVVPGEAVEGSALLRAMLAAGDTSIVERDVDGYVHFHASFSNAGILNQALDRLASGAHRDAVRAERGRILDVYEEVFDHRSFTGRSGTFYKYEGLGSVYWHMVSKLLVAVDEAWLDALSHGVGAAQVARLAAHYREIREGIGVHKSPLEYGAIPTDPYSHTPAFAGAQQPGMTGQVKEDLISRFSDMGVVIADGRIRFVPERVNGEFLQTPGVFDYVAADGSDARLDLEVGTMAYTLCQVPVVLHRSGDRRVEVTRVDAKLVEAAAVEFAAVEFAGLELDEAASAAVFDRSGEIARLDAFLGAVD